MMIPKDEIEQLLVLAEKATVRPWYFYGAGVWKHDGCIDAKRLGNPDETVIEANRFGYAVLEVREGDFLFIPAACALAPELGKEVLALRERVAGLEVDVEQVGKYADGMHADCCKFMDRIAALEEQLGTTRALNKLNDELERVRELHEEDLAPCGHLERWVKVEPDNATAWCVMCAVLEAHTRIKALEAERERTCKWRNDPDGNDWYTWYTECGRSELFSEEGPTKLGVVYCPFCGGRIELLPQPPEVNGG